MERKIFNQKLLKEIANTAILCGSIIDATGVALKFSGDTGNIGLDLIIGTSFALVGAAIRGGISLSNHRRQ